MNSQDTEQETPSGRTLHVEQHAHILHAYLIRLSQDDLKQIYESQAKCWQAQSNNGANAQLQAQSDAYGVTLQVLTRMLPSDLENIERVTARIERKVPKAPTAKTVTTVIHTRKASVKTLEALLLVKRGSDLDELIGRLEKQTCEAFVQYGVGAREYEQPFDDLHWCRLVRMALDFRAARGLPPDAATPYDDADLDMWLDEVRNQR